MNFWLHNWQLNRQAHSRTIQIIEVKHNMQKVIDNIKTKINSMNPVELNELLYDMGSKN